jgi:restriction system protein
LQSRIQGDETYAHTVNIPDFQSLMLPALTVLGNASPRSTVEVREALAKQFDLAPEALAQMLPSGKQTTFANRVAWAYSYLKQAGLISSPKRGVYEISDRGRSVLTSKPARIDIAFLAQFPEFQAFRQSTATNVSATTALPPESLAAALTPDEEIRTGYDRLRAALASQLLDRVKTVTPAGFEQLVVDLLVALGYGGSRKDAGQVVGGGGDEGIDGIIKEDRLGLDTIYVQAKRWQGTVGRPEIQRFAGALQGQRARKGVFMTTSTFTTDARSYAAALQTTIVLIDGPMLAQLMMDAGIGVSEAETIRILRADEDYFDGL